MVVWSRRSDTITAGSDTNLPKKHRQTIASFLLSATQTGFLAIATRLAVLSGFLTKINEPIHPAENPFFTIEIAVFYIVVSGISGAKTLAWIP